jgi:hypothetical protein
MRLSKVALQLYTLRDFCSNAKDLATTLKKVKAIGYDAIEFIRLDFASYRDLRKLADEHGLAISSIHEAGDRLLNHPQTVAEELAELGTDLAVYPYPAGFDFQKETEVDRLTRQLQHSSASGLPQSCSRIRQVRRRTDSRMYLRKGSETFCGTRHVLDPVRRRRSRALDC